MDDFMDHVALISGAAGNMGGTLAHILAERGVSLALLDHKQDRLQSVCGDMAGSELHLLIGNVDVTDAVSVEAAVKQAETKFHRIDFLLNIAGGYQAGKPVYKTTIDEWDTMFNLNTRSAFLLSRAVLPGMIERKFGKIVNVAAKPGLKGVRDGAAYSGAKAAVLRLTESLASEVKNLGINVNAIIPGTIDTPENRVAKPDGNVSEWASMEAVTDVILFLLSTKARAVHAAAIIIDGPESVERG